MPEGHTVHRTANRFQSEFVGAPVEVSSPQGRFRAEAKELSGKRMLRASAIGKHLFLDFETELTVHIHLGIYGKWQFHALQSGWPEEKGEIRVRFATNRVLAELRGPTACELLGQDQVSALATRLGPDPITSLTDHSAAERFVARVMASSAPIGQLLMDQSVISGIGNVYRAELLFRARLSPFRPGRELSRQQLEALWRDAGELMRLGVETGIMLTRDGFLKPATELAERYYVYKRNGLTCRVCGEAVAIGPMQGRKLYWCPSCQG